MRENGPQSTSVDIPWRTLVKVMAAIALFWAALQLIPVFLVVAVAVVLAVTLDPVVQWMESRGVARGLGSALVVTTLLAAIGAVVFFASTQLSSQAELVTSQMQKTGATLLDHLPRAVRDAFNGDAGPAIENYVGPALVRLTQRLAGALIVVALATFLTLYLLIEGARTEAWLLAFVSSRRRPKLNQTIVECRRVIFAYVAGNVATSVFATIFVFVALTILKVPAALLLALLAGVFDFVPVLGFILSSVPAVVLAFTVSQTTALIVLLLYIAYHTIENYLIAPWVYGDRLQLSNIAIILAFVVGAELAGVVGALIALPIAAAYPAIERIWLRDKLGDQVVHEHRAIQRHAK